MRFFEYEARDIVKRAGIPVTKYGFAKTADEARKIAADIGGPTVIKSQVLTGGRMKAGGVKFADTPDEAAAHAEDILQARDQRPHAARRAGRPQGPAQAGVLRRRRVGRDPQEARDAVQRHGRHRHRGGQRAAPRPRRACAHLEPRRGTRLPREGGGRADRRDRPAADARDPDPGAPRAAVQRVRHDPCRDQPAGRARGRQLRRPRRPHGDGERGAPAPAGAAEGPWRGRRGDARGARGDAFRDRGRGGRRAWTTAASRGTSPSSTGTSGW